LEQVCTFLEEQGALHQWNPITKGFDLNSESNAEGKKINPGNSIISFGFQHFQIRYL
jgi:hypothetical protein